MQFLEGPICNFKYLRMFLNTNVTTAGSDVWTVHLCIGQSLTHSTVICCFTRALVRPKRWAQLQLLRVVSHVLGPEQLCKDPHWEDCLEPFPNQNHSKSATLRPRHYISLNVFSSINKYGWKRSYMYFANEIGRAQTLVWFTILGRMPMLWLSWFLPDIKPSFGRDEDSWSRCKP